MAAIPIPSGSGEYGIEDDGKTYVLKAGELRTGTSGNGIFIGSSYHDDTVIIKGQVTQTGNGGAGIRANGADITIRIDDGGSVIGYLGIDMTGLNAHFINAGTLRGTDDAGLRFTGLNADIVNNQGGRIFSNASGSAAVDAFGMNSEIHNNGRIQGDYGINVTDANVTITNLVHGVIRGTTSAIFSESTEPSEKIRVVNNGLIDGGANGHAIETQDARETIVNHGEIKGKIYLGSGNDSFDNRGGTVDHRIEGGTGDDTLFVDRASTRLKEDGGSAGYDTVKSTVTYTLSENVERLVLLGNGNINGTGTDDGDDLFGNAGNNSLFGKGGVDTLFGAKGNDRLTGGANFDTFVFKTGSGHDTVTDFQNGIDKLKITDWDAITSFSDLKQHHLTVSGDDLIIHAGSDQLILLDTSKNELDNGDFVM